MTSPTSQLDPARFDQMVEPEPEPQEKILWGAPAIGRRIGCGADFVRDTLAKIEGSPVKRIGRRLCVAESSLIDFFR